MKRGRPKLNQEVKVIRVKLRLYEGGDDDLIAFFSRIPPKLRAAMVKQALRSGMSMGTDTSGASEEAFAMLDSLVSQ